MDITIRVQGDEKDADEALRWLGAKQKPPAKFDDGPFAVYVSGPRSDYPRAKKVVAALRKRGVFVLGDEWIAEVEKAAEAHKAAAGSDDHASAGLDAKLPRAVLAEAAEADLCAIEDATMVLCLTSEWGGGASGGVSIEAGAAMALERPIVTAGGPLHPVFRTAVLAEFTKGERYADHDEEAVEFIVAYAVGWSSARGLPVDRYVIGRPAPYGDDPPKVELDEAPIPYDEPTPGEAPGAPGSTAFVPKVVRPGDLVAAAAGGDQAAERARAEVREAMKGRDEL